MPCVIIALKKHRSDKKPRYRARWTNPYNRAAKPVYKIHWDKPYLLEWERKMDRAAHEEALTPTPLPAPEPPREQTATFAALVDAWRATRLAGLSPRTVTRYEGILRNYLLPAWGDCTLATIDRELVKRYFRTLEKQCSAAQLRKVQITASSICSEGIELGYWHRNPAARLRLPAPDDREMLALTAAEVRALAEAIDPRYRTLIYLASYTGLRAGELWALRRQDVDLAAGRLYVRRALKRAYGQGKPTDAPLFGKPKNGKVGSVRLSRFQCNLLLNDTLGGDVGGGQRHGAW